MMTDHPSDNEVVADRVALMHGRVEERQGRKANWPMVGIVGGLIAFLGVWGYVYFGVSGFASRDSQLVPASAVTFDDRAGGRSSSLFGDTSFEPEPEEPDTDMLAMKEQLARVLRELEEAKAAAGVRPDLPQEYKDELARMREQMDEMKLGFEAKAASYEGYIDQLKQQFEDANRLPPRPVSLQDSKWIRAQQITVSDDTGEAARLAAPSMVFDGSKEKLEEEEEDNKVIIEQFGRSFPDNAILTAPPQ